MKYFFLSVFITLPLLAATLSSPDKRIEGHTCKKEIQKITHEWMGKGYWKITFNENGQPSLLQPTYKFAHWILLEKNGSEEQISLINPTQIQKIAFDKKCKGAFTAEAHNGYQNPKGFTDEKLLGEMLNKEDGIIAVWSPRSPASVEAMVRLKKVSSELKVPVMFVMDPLASEKQGAQFIKEHKLDITTHKLSSLELTLRDGTLTYPNFFVYKDGMISGAMNPGLYTEAQYKTSVLKRLGRQ